MTFLSPLKWTRLGGTLTLVGGEEYVVSEITSAGLTLRCKATRICRIVAIGELPNLLEKTAGQPARSIHEIHALEQLTPEEGGAIANREAHLFEVLYGTPLPGHEPRPEYDPVLTTLQVRIERKSTELHDAGVKPYSIRTLKRQISLYRAYGPAGLRDGRVLKEEKAFTRADPRIIDAMIQVAHDHTNKSTVSRATLATSVKQELNRRYPGVAIALPSRNAMASYWKQLTHGNYTFGNAANRRTAANAPRGMFDSPRAIAPGAEVQIDSSPWDLYLKGPKGKPIKAVITIMIDKATRSIIAAALMPVAMTGADHAFLLARCLVPRTQRPQEPLEPFDLLTLPSASELTSEAEARLESFRPYIVPSKIVTDHGADFRSATFRSACQAIGITRVLASVHTPTDKAVVERAFKTIKDNFVALLPGFTGGSVDRKGAAPENDEGQVDIFTAQTLLDRWITIVYQNTISEGLRDPYDPSIELSPNAAYFAMYDFTGAFPIPLGPDEYIALLPTKSQCIRRDGITINYRRYDSEELGPLRGHYDVKSKRSRRWDIHWDPYDPQAVWVENPETKTWIRCRWMDESALTEPFSREVRARAREIRKVAPGMTHDQARYVTIQLADEAKQEQRQKDRLEMGLQLRKSSGVPIPDSEAPAKRPPFIEEEPISPDEVDPFGRYEPWSDDQ